MPPRNPRKDPYEDAGRPKKPVPKKPKKPAPPPPRRPNPPPPHWPHYPPHVPHHPPPYIPRQAPPPPAGCRNGDPSCGRGYICVPCYNGAVQPMGYAGVVPRAPVFNNCQPVYCVPRWC